MGNAISSIVSNPAAAVGGVWKDTRGSVNDAWTNTRESVNDAWLNLRGGRGGGGGGPGGSPFNAVYLRPDQMRQMGNQFQYQGAPPQIPQGMNVIPQWQRQQGMMQMQPQQFQPNWDVNAYNPNQNMQMRQQQMQSQMQPQMRGTPYQNMGMFGAFNPYMPRQR